MPEELWGLEQPFGTLSTGKACGITCYARVNAYCSMCGKAAIHCSCNDGIAGRNSSNLSVAVDGGYYSVS